MVMIFFYFTADCHLIGCLGLSRQWGWYYQASCNVRKKRHLKKDGAWIEAYSRDMGASCNMATMDDLVRRLQEKQASPRVSLASTIIYCVLHYNASWNISIVFGKYIIHLMNKNAFFNWIISQQRLPFRY